MAEYAVQQLIDDIAVAITPADFHEAFRASCDVFDQANAQWIAERGAGLVCRAGCSLCCSLRVDVFAHEIFLIADHLRAHFSAEMLAGLKARLSTHAARILPLTPFEHATQNAACPLLAEDGRCGIYAVRPLSCRRHHSLDFAACQFTYDHPADLEFPGAHDVDLFRALTEALRQTGGVYAEYGFDLTIYELGTALAEALDDAASWTRWHEGGQAFVNASVTPAG